MATTTQVEPKVPVAASKVANLFELRLGRSAITYTVSNIAGQPVVTYDDGSGTPRSFMGDEILREQTALGTLVTVTLELIPDLVTHMLTIVVPEVLLKGWPPAPERLTMPVVFHKVASSIAGPPTQPGPVQTYDVKIYDATASFIVS